MYPKVKSADLRNRPPRRVTTGAHRIGLMLLFALPACNQAEPRKQTQPGTLEQAYVLPPNRLIPAHELAEAIRQAGYDCGRVTAFGQIEFKGKPLDNYKIDCDDRSYLLTWLEGGSRIRPWPASK
jgi:hypothetical protein